MGKRRTRKEKERAVHSFGVSWSPKPGSQANVKRQIVSEPKEAPTKLSKQESAMLLAKEDSLKLIKKDIFKSLALASLIITLEVVIYLAWHK